MLLEHPLPTRDGYWLVIRIATRYISSAVSLKAAQWLIWSLSPPKFLSFRGEYHKTVTGKCQHEIVSGIEGESWFVQLHCEIWHRRWESSEVDLDLFLGEDITNKRMDKDRSCANCERCQNASESINTRSVQKFTYFFSKILMYHALKFINIYKFGILVQDK